MCHEACRDNFTVIYRRLPRLFAELELAHGDGRFPRLFRSLVKADLLILDDWGPDRLNASQRRDMMEIVEDRCGAGSTLITSQLPIIAEHNDTEAKPLIWRANPNEIVAARNRGFQMLDSIH